MPRADQARGGAVEGEIAGVAEAVQREDDGARRPGARPAVQRQRLGARDAAGSGAPATQAASSVRADERREGSQARGDGHGERSNPVA